MEEDCSPPFKICWSLDIQRVSLTPASATSSPTVKGWLLDRSSKWLELLCLMWMTFVKEEENGINGS